MTLSTRRRKESSVSTLTPASKILCNSAFLIWLLQSSFTNGFISTNKKNMCFLLTRRRDPVPTSKPLLLPSRSSNTELNVSLFGRTPEVQLTTSGDVEVRIEKTSTNSRRITGEVIIEAPIEDVWAILTDYDNLSTHVPNLVESRRKRNGKGEQGDGSYKCQIYQKGAQKIIGFQFGASVTLNMVEKIMAVGDTFRSIEQLIEFKCVESQFFSKFDGEWRVKSTEDGLSTILNYVVDVRPKGPVPVAVLEWRIREDVPTNLRAVKKAAIVLGKEGVMKMRSGSNSSGLTVPRANARNVNTVIDSASIRSERAMG